MLINVANLFSKRQASLYSTKRWGDCFPIPRPHWRWPTFKLTFLIKQGKGVASSFILLLHKFCPGPAQPLTMRRWQLLDCFAFCLFAVSMRRATGLAASRESGWRRGCSPKHRQEGVWKLSQLLQGQLWVDSDSCYTTGGRGEDVWWGGLWEPKGGAKHPSKGTVCAREGRLPGPARPLLPEGSEVPECPVLPNSESLTFIFKGPPQKLKVILPSQRDLV